MVSDMLFGSVRRVFTLCKTAHRIVFLNPNKKPVGFNVTLPFTCISSRKYMRSVSWRQLSFTFKNCDYLLQLSHIVPSALTKFIRLFECARVFDPVFHCSSCSNRSSTLFASYTLPALMSSRARSIPLFRGLLSFHPIFFDNVLRKERSDRGMLILTFSIFAVVCIIVFPFFISFLPQKYKERLTPPNFRRVFSAITRNVEQNNPAGRWPCGTRISINELSTY